MGFVTQRSPFPEEVSNMRKFHSVAVAVAMSGVFIDIPYM
jgi:hypothetical protein